MEGQKATTSEFINLPSTKLNVRMLVRQTDFASNHHHHHHHQRQQQQQALILFLIHLINALKKKFDLHHFISTVKTKQIKHKQ